MFNSPSNAEIIPAPDPGIFSGDALGFVLAGGRSSRMGADKALVCFDGRPLIACALQILRHAGLRVSIAGARAELEQFAPIIPDLYPDHGPLGGICSALRASSARWAVFLPVDVPLLPPGLVAYLLSRAQSGGAAITVAAWRDFAQTFPAVIDRAALPMLEQALAAGRLGCLAAFERAAESLNRPLAVLSVEEALSAGRFANPVGAEPDRWFLNLNTPEDLRRANERRARPIA